MLQLLTRNKRVPLSKATQVMGMRSLPFEQTGNFYPHREMTLCVHITSLGKIITVIDARVWRCRSFRKKMHSWVLFEESRRRTEQLRQKRQSFQLDYCTGKWKEVLQHLRMQKVLRWLMCLLLVECRSRKLADAWQTRLVGW